MQVEALQYFADQVANAIDAMAWVDMLEVSTLEEPEAVVLIDEHWRVRYVNRSALKLFSSGNIALGWQDPVVPLLADIPRDRRRSFALREARYREIRSGGKFDPA